jgi:hypothetical protein
MSRISLNLASPTVADAYQDAAASRTLPARAGIPEILSWQSLLGWLPVRFQILDSLKI